VGDEVAKNGDKTLSSKWWYRSGKKIEVNAKPLGRMSFSAGSKARMIEPDVATKTKEKAKETGKNRDHNPSNGGT